MVTTSKDIDSVAFRKKFILNKNNGIVSVNVPKNDSEKIDLSSEYDVVAKKVKDKKQ